jgi:hypothetical protein
MVATRCEKTKVEQIGQLMAAVRVEMGRGDWVMAWMGSECMPERRTACRRRHLHSQVQL